jgi:hypothetical protein
VGRSDSLRVRDESVLTDIPEDLDVVNRDELQCVLRQMFGKNLGIKTTHIDGNTLASKTSGSANAVNIVLTVPGANENG